MSISLNQVDDVSVIQLDGEIEIAVAAELKASLLEALESGREIRVSLDNAAALDVTAFQLLWSAEREARQRGLRFVVTGKMNESIRGSLEGMGLNGLWAR